MTIKEGNLDSIDKFKIDLNKLLIEKDNILVSSIVSNKIKITRFNSEIKAIPENKVFVLRLRDKIYVEYIINILKSDCISQKIKFLTGGIIPSLRKNDISDLVIHVPPIIQIKKLNKYFENYEKIKMKFDEQIAYLEKINKTTQQKIGKEK